jgi:hypothetical protein
MRGDDPAQLGATRTLTLVGMIAWVGPARPGEVRVGVRTVGFGGWAVGGRPEIEATVRGGAFRIDASPLVAAQPDLTQVQVDVGAWRRQGEMPCPPLGARCPVRDPMRHPRQPSHVPPELPQAPLGGGLQLPAGGLGFSVLRSVGTLGAVRGRSLGDILDDPIDGVAKLLVGTVVRTLSGRALPRATHGLGVSGAVQRAIIFAGESIVEGTFYYWFERNVKRRKPRAAAGYLRADRDELVTNTCTNKMTLGEGVLRFRT